MLRELQLCLFLAVDVWWLCSVCVDYRAQIAAEQCSRSVTCGPIMLTVVILRRFKLINRGVGAFTKVPMQIYKCFITNGQWFHTKPATVSHTSAKAQAHKNVNMFWGTC